MIDKAHHRATCCWPTPPIAYALQVGSQVITSEHAMAMFGLHRFEAVHEESTDARAVVGWGGPPDAPTVVMAFRGTVSSTNMRTNIKVSGAFFLVLFGSG